MVDYVSSFYTYNLAFITIFTPKFFIELCGFMKNNNLDTGIYNTYYFIEPDNKKVLYSERGFEITSF